MNENYLLDTNNLLLQQKINNNVPAETIDTLKNKNQEIIDSYLLSENSNIFNEEKIYIDPRNSFTVPLLPNKESIAALRFPNVTLEKNGHLILQYTNLTTLELPKIKYLHNVFWRTYSDNYTHTFGWENFRHFRAPNLLSMDACALGDYDSPLDILYFPKLLTINFSVQLYADTIVFNEHFELPSQNAATNMLNCNNAIFPEHFLLNWANFTNIKKVYVDNLMYLEYQKNTSISNEIKQKIFPLSECPKELLNKIKQEKIINERIMSEFTNPLNKTIEDNNYIISSLYNDNLLLAHAEEEIFQANDILYADYNHYGEEKGIEIPPPDGQIMYVDHFSQDLCINNYYHELYIEDAPFIDYAKHYSSSWRKINLLNTKKMGSMCFFIPTGLIAANLPELLETTHADFDGAWGMIYFNAPKLKTLYRQSLTNTCSLLFLELPSLEQIGGGYNLGSFHTLILSNQKKCEKLYANENIIWSSDQIPKEYCHIYVPKNLLQDYLNDPNWANEKEYFRAIEDYPNEINTARQEMEWLKHEFNF